MSTVCSALFTSHAGKKLRSDIRRKLADVVLQALAGRQGPTCAPSASATYKVAGLLHSGVMVESQFGESASAVRESFLLNGPHSLVVPVTAVRHVLCERSPGISAPQRVRSCSLATH